MCYKEGKSVNVERIFYTLSYFGFEPPLKYETFCDKRGEKIMFSIVLQLFKYFLPNIVCVVDPPQVGSKRENTDIFPNMKSSS